MKERVQTPEGVPRLFDLVTVKNETFKLAFFAALGNTVVANNLDQVVVLSSFAFYPLFQPQAISRTYLGSLKAVAIPLRGHENILCTPTKHANCSLCPSLPYVLKNCCACLFAFSINEEVIWFLLGQNSSKSYLIYCLAFYFALVRYLGFCYKGGFM